jgi:hypothetical protein
MANIKSRVQKLEEVEGIGRDKLFITIRRFGEGQCTGLRVNDIVFKCQPKESYAAMEKRVMAELENRPGALFVLVPVAGA